MTKWKRGLLKAWLALSLLWAVGFTIFLVVQLDELFGDGFSDGGLFIVIGLFYILPFGILPPLALLLIGSILFWIVTRFARSETKS